MNNLDTLRFLGQNLLTQVFTFKLSGPDAESFLHGQSTNSLNKIQRDQFQLDTLLDINGRLLCYFWVLKKSSDSLFLVFETEELARIAFERLDKFHIAEEVELSVIEEKSLEIIFDPQEKMQSEKGYQGNYFEEPCSFLLKEKSEKKDSAQLLNQLKLLRGVDLNLHSHLNKLLTDTIFFDLACDLKKGCFLGQETIGKIASRRGAAFYPVALETDDLFEISQDKILVDTKKVGTLLDIFSFGQKKMVLASLIREFRVEGFSFKTDNGSQFTVRNYPLLKYSREEKAIEIYDRAIELFSKNEDQKAIEFLQLAIHLNPIFEDAYESLGVLLGRHENYQEAIKLMHKLSELNPKSVMAHTNLSLFYMKTGEIEKAENHKAEATVKTFEFYGDEAKRKAEEKRLLEEKIQERSRRKQMFIDVLEIDENDSLALYGLADIAFEDEKYEDSRVYLEKVLATNPKYSVAYLLLGKCLLKLGAKSNARKTFEAGISCASKQGELMPANEMQRLLNTINP